MNYMEEADEDDDDEEDEVSMDENGDHEMSKRLHGWVKRKETFTQSAIAWLESRETRFVVLDI